VRFDRRLFEQGYDVLVLMREAERSEPDVAAAYREGRRRGHKYQLRMFASWPAGAFRRGVFASMCNVDVSREARRRTKTGWFVLDTASGVCAMAAPMVKQSFLEAILFAGVLLAFSLHGRRGRRAGLPWIAGGAALGVALPIAALLRWTFLAPFDLAEAWSQLVEFRTTALSTILADPTTSMVRRGSLLIVLATVSGILPILALMARPDARRKLDGSALGRAVAAVTLYGVAAVVAGGNYWPSYLLQLAPATVLGTALASDPPHERWLRPLCLAAAGTASPPRWPWRSSTPRHPAAGGRKRTGAWLQASSVPGDTALVLYGAAAVQQSSGLESPYPYLWSLPVRVYDPDLDHVQATLRGRSAPTWIVQSSALNSCDIDEDGELREQLNASYRIVADVCGAPVWLHKGLTRELAEPPAC
jgi:hypothetical protein